MYLFCSTTVSSGETLKLLEKLENFATSRVSCKIKLTSLSSRATEVAKR
jgi:hypothetical protein